MRPMNVNDGDAAPVATTRPAPGRRVVPVRGLEGCDRSRAWCAGSVTAPGDAGPFGWDGAIRRPGPHP